jgi:hypothetical protein
MKKTILAILMALPICASAAPFLVCDPFPLGEDKTQPVEFVVTISGITTPIVSTAITDSSNRKMLKLDLGPLNLTGTKTVTAKARNSWGSSGDSLPLTFTAGAPTAPSGITLSVN